MATFVCVGVSAIAARARSVPLATSSSDTFVSDDDLPTRFRGADWSAPCFARTLRTNFSSLQSAGMCFSEVYIARQFARDASHCILTRFGVFIDGDLF
jgi:hypothetical protein